MEVLLLIALLSALWFWFDSMQTNASAKQAGLNACAKAGVSFLDDSTSLAHIRLRRMRSGSVGIERDYQFEFSSDGSTRYRGQVRMQGRRVTGVTMDAYRLGGEE